MPLVERFLSRIRLSNDGCWIWTASCRNGYGQIGVARRVLYAHRLSYELFCGEVPSGLHVCHHCDVPACVNPGHLFLGTRAENMADAVAKGRTARGERHGQARLSEGQVRQVRLRAAQGVGLPELARHYGVAHETIRRVVRGMTWTCTEGIA